MFLFILVIDDLISYLKKKCIEEPLIGLMHCLLHADDTAVTSTERKLFIKKCNFMLQYMKENCLYLNMSKSSYMIINAKADDYKADIHFGGGILEYKAKVTYLGAIISDTGIIQHDVNNYLSEKSPNVTIKFNNFCRKNFLAPIGIKLKVLDICATTSLPYSCETWANCTYPKLESLYRKGLKYALSLRCTTTNEIVYLKSSRTPLTIQIKKRQLHFWNTLQENLNKNPENPLRKIIEKAEFVNSNYMNYYKNLVNLHETSKNCQKNLLDAFHNVTKNTVRAKAESDAESRYGAYMTVNPELKNIGYPLVLETDRIIISRYRSGFHNLNIEKGRMCNPKIPREERLCLCNNEIQTLEHCLLRCTILQDLREQYSFPSVNAAFGNPNIATFLLQMENILRIGK